MRFVLKITSVILALVATLFAIAFFLPNRYSTEHTTEISVNRDTCLIRLRNPQTWSIWMSPDEENKIKKRNIEFTADAELIASGLNGRFTQDNLIHQTSIDTIWIESSPAGSLIRWKSVWPCELPFGRYAGLLNKLDWERQAQQRLNALQKYLDESTLGPPIQLNQDEAIQDQ
jgi:hypothetical protein